ncbi:hypothetical protein SAMD00024442_11_4 [Candidatus Symbiothrix dinenymphae]|nr:hypothetical protein SAMD00024442_11_4 [Candidatus Symbiothrix dinenymphae]
MNAVITILTGGLGNQMFYYACHTVLRHRYAFDILSFYFIKRANEHQGYELGRVFDIPDRKNLFFDGLSRFVRKYTVCRNDSRNYIKYPVRWLIFILDHIGFHIISRINTEGWLCFDSKLLQPRLGLTFYIHDGYWSETFFREYESEIREKFRFNPDKLNPESANAKIKIEKCNSVSLHVRRGDYLHFPEYFGEICTLDYYEKAIDYICSKVDSPVFYVFSDDVEWVKNNLRLPGEAVFVDWNTGEDSWQDMCLMSYCKHNIVANSTFSWWGAWLNRNEGKTVIAPFRFCNGAEIPDFIPASWMTVGEFDF